MQLADLNTYLPDDILCKSDRASMFSSLENRSPFLDHEIYDLAKSLPLQMKINNKKGKYVLKNILSVISLKNCLIGQKKVSQYQLESG